jgi:polyphosphate kinase
MDPEETGEPLESADSPVDASSDASDATGERGAPEPSAGRTLADGYARYLQSEPTPSVDDGSADLDSPALYLNRELSELSFHQRVLFEALDDRNPLLERVKFLAILTNNLDEFFMKRIGGLKQQIEADVTELSPDGRTPREQWEAALETCREMFRIQSACFRDTVHGLLSDAGIDVLEHDELTAREQASIRSYFESDVLPTLTPLTFDPAHPFPFISNLSLSLAVRTRREGETPKFSRVKIPENRPRLVRVREEWTDRTDERERFVPLEEVVAANLDLLFPNVDILDYATFRVTRNAEVRRNEDVAEGLIEMIEGVLRERRFATVVRVEVEEGTPEPVRELLRDQLELDVHELFERPSPLDFRDLMRLAELDRPDLKLPQWNPRLHPRLTPEEDDEESPSLFEVLRRDDVLVHHPYHSFEGTVQRFFESAAHDEDVLAIKATIYRTAHDSRVIESLIEAARNGKQVAVMVELKARFDEENNLRWVRRLEEEGIHVAYGTIGLKTHTKTALVVRDEPDGVQLYSHVGTGNYHSQTAKTYTDLGLLTADADIGQDLTRLFNFFTGHSMHEEYRDLLVAPGNMRERFTDLVRREAEHAEAGEEARIVAKMNSLEDPEMVAELYRASMAGVDVDLVVRGICRLRPGIEGLSENVTVRSVVGRFLEHSRIFRFHNRGETEYYIGSADWMTRNLDRRVEAVTPVEDPSLQAELDVVLETMLADNRKAWEMDADGNYTQRSPGDDPVVDAHEVLMERAERGAPPGDRSGFPHLQD